VQQKANLTPWTQAAKVGFGVLVLVAILCVILVMTLWGARRALTIAANEQGIFPYLIGRARWRDEDGQRQSGWVMWDNNRALTAGSVIANGKVTAMMPAGFEREQAETTARAQYVQMAAAIYQHPPIISGNKRNGTGDIDVMPELEPGEPVLNWPSRVPLNWMLNGAGASLHNLALGVTLDPQTGQPSQVRRDMAKLIHIAVGGSPGSGKSVFLQALAYQLVICPERPTLALVDLDGVTLSPFANSERLLYPFADTERDALAIFQALADELERRKNLYSGMPGAYDLASYNQRTDDPLSPVVLLCDEATALLGDKSVETAVRRVALRGRKFGLWCVLAGQDWKASSLDSAIKNQLSTSVQFHARSPAQSRVLLGIRGAEALTVPGRALAALPGCEIVEMQAAQVGYNEIVAALQGQRGPAGAMPVIDAEDGADDDPAAGLSEDQIEMIRDLAAEGQSDSAIAQQVFGYRNARRVEQVRAVLDRDT